MKSSEKSDSRYYTHSYVTGLLWLLIALLPLLTGGRLAAQPQADHKTVTEVRELYPSEWGIPFPSGLSYALKRGHLALVGKNHSGQPKMDGSVVAIITPYEDHVATAELSFATDNAINIAYDDALDQLLLLNSETAEVARVSVDAEGIPDADTLSRADIAGLGLNDANGMDVDTDGRRLYILDSGASQIVSASLDDEFELIEKVNLSHLDVGELRGLAVHPQSHNLFVIGPREQMLYELTHSGQTVNTYDLSALALVDPQGLSFGPSADLTDDPETIHLFLADSNLRDRAPSGGEQSWFSKLLQSILPQSMVDIFDIGSENLASAASSQKYGRILEVVLTGRGNIHSTRTVTYQVAGSDDDAEEKIQNGAVDLDSSDLELIREGNGEQLVGIRFRNIDIPAGATIFNAFIEFAADEKDGSPTDLVIHGEAAGAAASFAGVKGNISGRSLTTASVPWPDVPPWDVKHEQQRTPDLSPVVQEIVDQANFRSGNAIAFIISGMGTRTAEAYDGEPSLAPRLVIEYVAPADPPALPSMSTLSDEGDEIRFAVIGDYGKDNSAEARVASLVAGWNPDFVITTGDNNYPDGELGTIDETVGQYYGQYIGDYQGSYGAGSSTNRFWPTLGNHDWRAINCIGRTCGGAHFDYFNLPNNERYYDVDHGLVHLFAVNSNRSEPDGRKEDSVQAEWLREQLSQSDACFRVVYFHHAAFSSGKHGSVEAMQWPFADWGADAVFAGHDHLYERLDVSGMPYFVNGAGGAGLYDFSNEGNLPPEATSMVRYNLDHGAMLVAATSTDITYQFFNTDGILIDEHLVAKNCVDSSSSVWE